MSHPIIIYDGRGRGGDSNGKWPPFVASQQNLILFILQIPPLVYLTKPFSHNWCPYTPDSVVAQTWNKNFREFKQELKQIFKLIYYAIYWSGCVCGRTGGYLQGTHFLNGDNYGTPHVGLCFPVLCVGWLGCVRLFRHSNRGLITKGTIGSPVGKRPPFAKRVQNIWEVLRKC